MFATSCMDCCCLHTVDISETSLKFQHIKFFIYCWICNGLMGEFIVSIMRSMFIPTQVLDCVVYLRILSTVCWKLAWRILLQSVTMQGKCVCVSVCLYCTCKLWTGAGTCILYPWSLFHSGAVLVANDPSDERDFDKKKVFSCGRNGFSLASGSHLLQ